MEDRGMEGPGNYLHLKGTRIGPELNVIVKKISKDVGGTLKGKKEGDQKRKEAIGKNEFVLDKADRMILNEIQKKFPVSHRPYLVLARKLNLGEKEVMERVQRLKDVGIIRRIGASFSAKLVGFSSTLCAARVPDHKIEEFVTVVNAYPGVTHNYEREGEFNVWFTLIAPSRMQIKRILTQISRKTGVTEILDLPALKTFKISVDFNFD